VTVRRAFTLVELLIAGVVVILVLGVVCSMLLSGAHLFDSGNEAARGPEAALLLMDRLEDDVSQVLQVPGDPRPPLRITGRRLTFYRPSVRWSNAQVIVGEPASWDLVRTRGGRLHPACDGIVLEDIHVKDWALKLVAPDAKQQVGAWYLEVVARFNTGSLFGRDYVLARLLRLPQPTSNFLNFLAFGPQMIDGAVQMLPRPRGDASFDHLGPPDPGGS